MLKYSRQREAIMDYLSSTTSHPTADQVYLHVRKVFPNISLGTVYRNLSLLASLGEIQKLSFGDAMDHFDANTKPHCHVMCSNCGRIDDLPCELPETLDETASSCYDGLIFGHSIQFYGLCRACAEKENKNFPKTIDKTSAL